MVHELSPAGAVRSLVEVVTDKSLGEDLGPLPPMLCARKSASTAWCNSSAMLSLSRSEQARAAAEPALMEVVRQLMVPSRSRRATHRSSHRSPHRLPRDLPPVLIAADDLTSSFPISSATQSSTTGRWQHQSQGPARGPLAARGRHRHGIGIGEENWTGDDRVYREKRPETASSREGPGLAIVKRRRNRAGGRLEAASTWGRVLTSRCCSCIGLSLSSPFLGF
jgi:hypothetical protein